MEESLVVEALAGLPLGPLRYFRKTGSTNDEAASWAASGAPDLALVVADEQTAGRGRMGRRWHTPPGAALAFSLVLRPSRSESFLVSESNSVRYTALGALAVCQSLRSHYGLEAGIKWPNDVLLAGRKAAGVLAEAQWDGRQLSAVILGIGVNVNRLSVPRAELLNYPATCVEEVLGRSVPRHELLSLILSELLDWRERLWEEGFIQEWEGRMALRGQRVELRSESSTGQVTSRSGTVLGLDETGSLQLQEENGEVYSAVFGEIHPLVRHSIIPV